MTLLGAGASAREEKPPGGTRPAQSLGQVQRESRTCGGGDRGARRPREPGRTRGTYPVIAFWGQGIRHPGPEPRAGGLDGHGVTYARQLATGCKRATAQGLSASADPRARWPWVPGALCPWAWESCRAAAEPLSPKWGARETRQPGEGHHPLGLPPSLPVGGGWAACET